FPLLYMALIFGTGYLGEKSSTRLTIAVIDSSGKFTGEKIAKANAGDPSNVLTLVTEDPQTLAKNFEQLGFDGYAIIPANTMVAKSAEAISIKSNRTLGAIPAVQAKLNSIWNDI